MTEARDTTPDTRGVVQDTEAAGMGQVEAAKKARNSRSGDGPEARGSGARG